MTVAEIVLHRLKLPLITPYRLSYRVYEDFDPIVVEVRDVDGRLGWGEGHISPGHTFETIEGGWRFCAEHAERILGRPVAEAKASLEAVQPQSPVAAAALITALEMLAGHPFLKITAPARLPLLTPFNATEPGDITAEVETRLDEGFRTLKIKVGKDVDADLARVKAVQAAAKGRATLRLDANRGFNREDGCRFAASLDPEGIELFEQPCESKAWDDNAAVAGVSTVPVMLDESIYGIADIERAADIKGIGFIKLKLKKMGGLDLLAGGLARIRELGMVPVLGDGVSSEIGCWMEACIARETIDNAGEFNGFLKPKARLFKEPLRFKDGALELDEGFWPEIDREALAAHRLEEALFKAPLAETAKG
ncbi:MAG TPA: enolase C-terminal domain-like protein [Alphaproteobacteria bacterium]|nr:enolase C-terminal domain-like protein [Alphaproteobacteria bacterium]